MRITLTSSRGVARHLPAKQRAWLHKSYDAYCARIVAEGIEWVAIGYPMNQKKPISFTRWVNQVYPEGFARLDFLNES